MFVSEVGGGLSGGGSGIWCRGRCMSIELLEPSL